MRGGMSKSKTTIEKILLIYSPMPVSGMTGIVIAIA